MKCQNCRFYNELHEGLGECRRYAPRPYSDELRWEWPQVTSPSMSWCGEFEERRCHCTSGPKWPTIEEAEQEAADWRDHQDTTAQPSGI